MRSLTVLALALLAVSSEAAAQGTPPQQPTRLPVTRVVDDTMSLVTVQNGRAVPVTVYLESGALERRLGVVAAKGVATLALPNWATRSRGGVRLLARPDGEPSSLATANLAIASNARIGLVVPPRTGAAATDSVPVLLTAEERASTTVTIDNPGKAPITVFAERGVKLVRLGEIPASTQATLRFPKDMVRQGDNVRVFVRSAGGFELATRPLTLKPGDHISFDIVF